MDAALFFFFSSFFFFLLFAALVPRPAFYQLPVEGPDHPARPSQGFRWRMMPVATDIGISKFKFVKRIKFFDIF